MELIIISSKKSTSSQAIALPGGQEIQVLNLWLSSCQKLTHIPVPPPDAQLKANMLLLYFVMLCARFYTFACSVCLISLSCCFRGSRAENVSRQFFVSWLCRVFISSRGSISLNFFAPCFFQYVLWLQSRGYFTAIFVP